MLDRSITPAFQTPKFKPFEMPEIRYLRNGIPLCLFNKGDQQIFKLELLFSAGSVRANIPGTSGTVVNLLREGSKSHAGSEINELLDYYGAFLETKSGIDHTEITLYGRSDSFEELIPIFSEIILDPVFDQNKIDKHLLKNIQQLEIKQKKTSYWSSRLLRRSLFGEQHPYSNFPSKESYESLNREGLRNYYEEALLPSLKTILISGAFNEKTIWHLLDDNFGGLQISKENFSIPQPGVTNPEDIVKQLEGTSQASIAIGKIGINNKDPEYPDHSILIKVLGGYFGSRLMKSLREDAGLTYGVHAYILHLLAGSIVQISADVTLGEVDRSVQMTFDELEVLRNSEISDEEMTLVRNYMSGEYANNTNSVFDFAGLYKRLVLQDLPEDYYEKFYQHLATITPERLKSVADDLLDPTTFSTVKVY